MWKIKITNYSIFLVLKLGLLMKKVQWAVTGFTNWLEDGLVVARWSVKNVIHQLPTCLMLFIFKISNTNPPTTSSTALFTWLQVLINLFTFTLATLLLFCFCYELLFSLFKEVHSRSHLNNAKEVLYKLFILYFLPVWNTHTHTQETTTGSIHLLIGNASSEDIFQVVLNVDKCAI